MLDRREFGRRTLGLAAGALGGGSILAPAIVRGEGNRPRITEGVAAGDVSDGRAVIWSRTDRPARMIVEYSTTESFRDPKVLHGTAALPACDHTARAILTGLPDGQTIFYRVRFRDLTDPKVLSEPVVGRFRSTPKAGAPVTFAWGGDTAGQGWGINPDFGGMRIYESIRKANPDVFIHSGDNIYADNPIPAEIDLGGGKVWKNLVTEATSKVAETLDEFRGRYRYNLMDENLRRFQAEVPLLVQWDDHEVLNNWYPGERLPEGGPFKVKAVDLLAARAKRAFFEYVPTSQHPDDPERIYRKASYGPLLDVFLLDQRSYKSANSPNRQRTISPDAHFLGPDQLAWLKRELVASKAAWKVVASDMPLGLVVGDGPADFEGLANGDPGVPLGRELELADLLRHLRDHKVQNVAWVTADVHYAAAHHFDPGRAAFQDFDPFWEFVAGPLNAGTFGPGKLDPTFGPREVFKSIPADMKPNRPPSEGLQFFGLGKVDPESRTLAVSLHDIDGKRLYEVTLKS